MKFQKKHFIVGAVVLSVGLLAGFAVLAGSYHPRFGDKNFHFGPCVRGFHPRFGDHDVSQHILSRLDHGVEYLDLSETQKQTYAEIRRKIQDRLTEGMEERKKLFMEIRGEMDRENPDLVKVANLMKERIKGMPALMEEHVDLFIEFYNILDEDQKAQLVGMIRERAGRRFDQ